MSPTGEAIEVTSSYGWLRRSGSGPEGCGAGTTGSGPLRFATTTHQGVSMSTAQEDFEPRVAELEEQVVALHRQLESLREELRALAHVVGRGELPSEPSR